MALFPKGSGSKAAYQKSPYINPGTYIFEVQSAKITNTRGGKLFAIGNFMVVAVLLAYAQEEDAEPGVGLLAYKSEERKKKNEFYPPSNKTGSLCGISYLCSGEYADTGINNAKNLMLAMAELNNEAAAFAEYAEEKGIVGALTGEQKDAAWDSLNAVLLEPEDAQAGFLVQANVTAILTKKGGDFTVVQWSPVPEEEYAEYGREYPG